MKQFPKAPRVRGLLPYFFETLAQNIKELTKAGASVVRMDMGSPDMPPPSLVLETMSDLVQHPDIHGYSGYRGLPSLRQAVADYYKRRFEVDLDPDTEILPLIGSKEGIVNLALATVGAGDAVLVPSLSYPAYAIGAVLAGATPVGMPLTAANNYLPDLQAIPPATRQNAKLLWLNYPNNPTGAFASLDYYQQAVDFCLAHDILLCSDNPYLEIVYDGLPHAPSVFQAKGAKEVAVEFISCSKTYNMAGWRIGAMVGPREAIDTLLLVKSNIDSSHFMATMQAAAVAINTTPQSWIDERNLLYQRRRDIILNTLPQIGLHAEFIPKGSMYVWAKVVLPGVDGFEWCERSLNQAHVSVTPGSVYSFAEDSHNDGAGYVRFSISTPESKVGEAMNRLSEYWQAHLS
jgi:LL-diaminopimelate aminotransferase